MPIYEYGCAKCGKKLEILVRKSSDVPTRCPACGTPKPQKLFSTFAVAAHDPTPPLPVVPFGRGFVFLRIMLHRIMSFFELKQTHRQGIRKESQPCKQPNVYW